MSTNLEIADTIRAQLGSQAFVMMGARHLLAVESGLQFRVGTNAKGVNCVRITLDASDTYTVSFFRVAKYDAKELGSDSFVYADQLAKVIEKGTGLYLSL